MCRYLIVVDDIWDITIWEKISCALPDNTFRYRIITTTRNNAVAEQVGIVYELKPLCLHDSRRLFYPRLFGNDDNVICLTGDLIILYQTKKCASVPLAIISIDTLLASKGRNKWEMYKVYRSVTAELENSLDLQDLGMILSLSYHNLPPHLKFCLLHLSVFPGDYDIDKDRLVRLWIAEGFIQCEIPGESLFDLGETYYHELKNRLMIQPVYRRWDNETIEYCLVNDMGLDLICSKSKEEDFVTVYNDVYQTYSSEKRLSFQNSMVDHARHLTSMNMQQVRSLVVFPFAVNLMPALLSFRVLRVLDLQDCHLSHRYILKDLRNLIHMRYLGLRRTHIAQLSKEIGNLQLLQTLDVTGNGGASEQEVEKVEAALRNEIAMHHNHPSLEIHW
ncbi:hypothetical protein SETIT_8G195200v2 [Setaria italica]|uniref:Uncharacterized protein n=1 Tax=Setaria italica TaxID=4555 RepID=K3ZLA8_SETIT|nr:hypothetical protein SETIT_8G195200v2 [Setaria italica]